MSFSSRPLTQLPYQELYDHAYHLMTELMAAYRHLAEDEQSIIRDRLSRTLNLGPRNAQDAHLEPAGSSPRRVREERKPRQVEVILCGDCDKEMTRAQYKVHICRPGGRNPYVSGGGPGLGRRR